MPTQFTSEHVFRAPSIDAVFAAYFSPAHLIQQDKELDIIERKVLELVDDGPTLRRVCRIVPRRQLPVFVRPFVTTPLHYLETALWRRAENLIEIEIRPSILKAKDDRPVITALYRLSRLLDGTIHRRYEGIVSVDIALIASKLERGIVAEFQRSMPVAAACTQAWLDRTAQEDRSLSPQA
jgi:hypothetical protein